MGWSGIATDEETTEPYRGITIRDCILHDNGWSGIDLAAADGFNVSLENSDAGFWVEDQLGIYGTPDDNLLVFKNNIAYNNDPRGWAAALVIMGEDTWQVVATHNNWSVLPGFEVAVINQGTEYTPGDINSGAFQIGNISVHPQFVDATVPDVHLRFNSPCIDAGIEVGLPYLGLAPDMGAFEFAAYQLHLPLILKE